MAHHADWTPRSNAAKPAAFPPHPPLQSGGWYRGTVVEAPGPGRPPVVTAAEKSSWLAIVLTALFGPLGLCYLSTKSGLIATVLTVAVLGYAGMGFLPLLLIWPLTVAAAAWGVQQRINRAPAPLVQGRRQLLRTTPAGRRRRGLKLVSRAGAR